MDISGFTPLSGFLGGLCIGAAALLLMAGSGRIAGVSGALGGVLGAAPPGQRAWRLWFLLGLVAGGLVYARVAAPAPPLGPLSPLAVLGAVLVGVGTRMGNGCTSGHGVCGLARGSARSLAATLTFMAAGFLTVWLLRHVF